MLVRWLPRDALLHPFTELAGKNQPDHAEITNKRPPGMSEGSRLIPFNDEVAEPCKAVTDDWPEQREPGMAKCKGSDQHSQSNDGPEAMQQPISGMAVRTQVEEEELVVAGELRRAHNDCL